MSIRFLWLGFSLTIYTDGYHINLGLAQIYAAYKQWSPAIASALARFLALPHFPLNPISLLSSGLFILCIYLF
jgi:hypothetical protein